MVCRDSTTAYVWVSLGVFVGASFFLLSPVRAHAAVGDIGWWRDCVGGQIPGTIFSAGFDFDAELRNDGIYSKPDNATIQLDEAGTYLIIASIRGVDTSNGRYNPQARVALTSGSGTLFTSYYTGYSRDNSENVNWTRAVGVVLGASSGAQVQVQRRRDTDAPTSGSVACESDVQVVRIAPTNYGLYAFGNTSNTYGGTSPNTVDITALSSESDTAAISGNTTTDTVTVKGDNKRYLVLWSVSGATGGSRTQRIGELVYDGSPELATRSYCYQRSSADEYCGLGSMDLIQTSTADRTISAEVYRGPGVAADDGGADNDGSFVEDGNGQLLVLELPDSAEVFRSHDSTGLQDITAAVSINSMRNVDFSDSTSFSQSSNSAMSVASAADIFVWGNVWTARNNVSASTRLTAYGQITINGTGTSTGEHGNYTRGNQGTVDTFAGSFHPAGIFAVSGSDTIGLGMAPLSGTEGGGTDRTQAGTVGFLALNLDTLGGVPTVQTSYTGGIGASTATLFGHLLDTGGFDATEHGFAYSTDATLSTGVSTTTLGAFSGTGVFQETLSGLTEDATYYYRAYATNSIGTGYGTIRSFTEGNSIVRRTLRLFEGFVIKLITGKMVIYGS